MKTNSLKVKLFAILLAVVLLGAPVTPSVFTLQADAATNELNLGIISDIHYYPEEYKSDTPAFEEFALAGNKHYINEDGILNSMLAFYKKQALDGKIDCLVIPGDFTRNGEYAGHKELAGILEQFENDTGVPVLVINGNHDINNKSAASFANGEYAVSADDTSPEEWLDIYKNLGYDLACATYTPPEGAKAGMLSYAVSMNGYRFILIDGGKYSKDNTEKGKDSHETAGNYTDDLMEWVLAQIKEANEKGETIIGVDHWSLVPHYDSQAYILQGFALDNYLERSEALADAGMHYIITGHSHSNDVATHISDNGESITDIETCSLMEFPHTLRTVQFKANGKKVNFDYQLHEIDEVLPVTSHGVTYEKPYRTSFSFSYSYKEDMGEYAKGLVKPLLGGLFEDITEEGGLAYYLDNRLDLKGLLSKYTGPLTDNVMSFVYDLGSQIDERYIKDPEYTFTVLNGIIDQLCDMEVSDLQCTALKDEYGWVGNEHGTFGDAVMMVMISMVAGDEVLEDPFMIDVIDRFENGDLGKKVFDKLYDLLITQLIEDEILPNLYVNLGSVFDNTSASEASQYVNLFVTLLAGVVQTDISSGDMTKIVKAVSVKDGKTSYLDLANAVLKVLDKLDVLEGGSIDGALGAIMDEYLTESQYQAWGHTFAYIITDFCDDNNPVKKADRNGSVNYNGKRSVPLDDETYRLPQLISVSLGNDSETERNISWYSKYSLTETDIEIVKLNSADDTPVFTGKSVCPSGVTVEKSSEQKDRTFPGVDLGIIGILPFTLHLNRHIVKVSGLEAGKYYAYRAGNAKYGWWSKSGIISTADGSDEVTFLHLTDSQGQNEKQYKIVSDVLDKATSLYPDTDLIIHSGDMVDEGSNVNYWRYFFGCSDVLRSVPVMAVSGNHEEKGDYALVDNFVLPDSKEQDTVNGYYYSFDYNNVHFIMLNTNDSDKNGLSSEQLGWLKTDANKSNAKWKIVVLHKATYSNGSHFDDSEVEGMRAQFSSLMPELGIDMVFQGHDHVYLRTDAMNKNEVADVQIKDTTYNSTVYSTKVDPDGTVYAITGASGCKNYQAKSNSQTDELFPRAEKIVNADSPVFAGVRIVGNTLYYDAYTVKDGTAQKIDSFAIEKNKELGDADFDGMIESEDAQRILQMAIDIVEYDEDDFKMCDVDRDNHITVKDARLVLRKAAGLESY